MTDTVKVPKLPSAKEPKLPWVKGKTRFVNIGQDVDEARP